MPKADQWLAGTSPELRTASIIRLAKPPPNEATSRLLALGAARLLALTRGSKPSAQLCKMRMLRSPHQHGA